MRSAHSFRSRVVGNGPVAAQNAVGERTRLPHGLKPPVRRKAGVGCQKGDPESDRGARDESIVRIAQRRKRSRLFDIGSDQRFDAKAGHRFQRIAPGRETGNQADLALVVQHRDFPEADDRGNDFGSSRSQPAECVPRARSESLQLSGGEPQERVRVGQVTFQRWPRRGVRFRPSKAVARARPLRDLNSRMTSTRSPEGKSNSTRRADDRFEARLRCAASVVRTMLATACPRRVMSTRPPSRATSRTILGSRRRASLNPMVLLGTRSTSCTD